MKQPPRVVATFRVLCPACRREVEIAAVVQSIETIGLSLVDVKLGASFTHDDCPGQ